MNEAAQLSKRDDALADLKAHLRIIEWMMGVTTVLTLVAFIKVFLD